MGHRWNPETVGHRWNLDTVAQMESGNSGSQMESGHSGTDGVWKQWVTDGIWKQCFHTVCSNGSNNVIYISISSINISGTIVDNYPKPNNA